MENLMKKFGKKLLAFAISIALLVSGGILPDMGSFSEIQAAAATHTVQNTKTGMMASAPAEQKVKTGNENNVIANAIAEEQEKQAQDYFVSDIQVNQETSQAEVTFQTVTDAEIIVAIYSEDGQQMKASANKKVCYEDTKVILEFSEKLPEYFIVKAFMVDVIDYTPLSSPYVSQLYTEEMQKVMASTIYDYDSDRVVNLDSDDETNFAVYNEGVVAVKETSEENIIEKQSDGSYVIKNASDDVKALKSGDIFSCDSQDGDLIVVDVDTVNVEGDQITLTDKGDSSLDLDDVFDTVKIESDGSQDKLSVDNSELDENLVYDGLVDESGRKLKKKNLKKAVNVDTSAGKSLQYSISKSVGGDLSAKITGSISFGVTANIRVYVSHSYQFVSLTVDYALTPQVQVKAGFSHDFWIGKIRITTPVPGVVLVYRPCIPLSFSGAINFKGKIYGTLGGAYDSDTGIQNKCIYPKIAGSIEANVSFSVGVSGRLALAILDDDLASVTLDKSLLLNITGTDTLITSSTTSVHDCKACLCGEVNVEFKCSLTANLTKKIKKEKTLIDIKIKLTDWYYSLTYGEFGFQKCPHIRYKVTVNAVDAAGNAVSGAAVEGTGLPEDPVTDEKGSTSFYLAPGAYALIAKATDMRGRSDIYVKDVIKKVRIKMDKNEDITGKLELYGDACRHEDGSVHLTELQTWTSGSAWYALPINTTGGFEASFKYFAGGGRDQSYGGADGIVLNFSSKTGIGDNGGAMGFAGEYGVELDSYPNNSGDPSKKHVAIINNSASNHIVYEEDDRVDDSVWHNVIVKYNKGTMQVYLDGSEILHRSEIELDNEVYVGLTAATGAGYNVHYIKDFNITVNSRDISVLSMSNKRQNTKKKTASVINGEQYSGEVEKDGTKVTASFSGLKADKDYLIVEAKNVASEDVFNSDNLLYIDQGTADASGKLSFCYIPKESDYSDIRLYGDMVVGSDSDETGDSDNSGNAGGEENPGDSDNAGNEGNTENNSETSGDSKPVKVKKPAKVTAMKVKSKNKKIMVSWKKISASGYRVQYAANKKFKTAKSVTVGKSAKVTLKKGLKKNKTYFVRVQAFNKNGKVKKYGSFSSVKKIKVK